MVRGLYSIYKVRGSNFIVTDLPNKTYPIDLNIFKHILTDAQQALLLPTCGLACFGKKKMLETIANYQLSKTYLFMKLNKFSLPGFGDHL